MTFTNELPTVPGFYAWRETPESQPKVFVIYEWMKECWSADRGLPIQLWGGQWCRLVPAEEIEKAFHEGVEAWGTADATSDLWENSRAKRVMEGKE